MGRPPLILIFPHELRRRTQSLPLEAQLIVKRSITLYVRYLQAMGGIILTATLISLFSAQIMLIPTAISAVMLTVIHLIFGLLEPGGGRERALKSLIRTNELHLNITGTETVAMGLVMVIGYNIIQLENASIRGFVLAVILALSSRLRHLIRDFSAVLKDEPGLPRTARRTLKRGNQVSA